MATTPAPTEPRPCWFVGASYFYDDRPYEDQTERFLRDGIWENGYEHRHLAEVRSIRPGDRIAIKSTYKRKWNLPFDNFGEEVPVMAIKAVGTVTKNRGDGRIVEVDWTPVVPNREWYFHVHLPTIRKVSPGTGVRPWAADALIKFTFENQPQDYPRFLREWNWP